MSAAVDVISAVLLLSGSALALVAAVGLLRLEDTFLRIHVATKPATLSVVLVMAAAILQVPDGATDAKLALAVVLQFWTTPVASHLLGRVVGRHGNLPEE